MLTDILIALWALLAFIIAIAILIVVHEYGHFIVARSLGIKVLRFSVGFGKTLFSYQRKEGPEYVLAAFPIGGYVKMLDEREGPVAEQERHLAFNRQSLWKRSAVVIAGPLFNILFAIFAYWIVYVIGVSHVVPMIGEVAPDSIAAEAELSPMQIINSIDGEPVHSWHEVHLELVGHLGSQDKINLATTARDGGTIRNHVLDLQNWQVDERNPKFLQALGIKPYRPPIAPYIESIQKAAPAEKAGLRVGDKVIRANGQAINNWTELVEQIITGPSTISLDVERDGKIRHYDIPLDTVNVKDKKYQFLGISSAEVEWPEDLKFRSQYSLLGAWVPAWHKTWHIFTMSFYMLYKMIVGEISVKAISGPVGIAQGAGYTASLGIVPFISFMAIISISLAMINLLPIPVLDGGHLLFYLIEAIIRRPVSDKVQMMGMRIGVCLLIVLMVVAMYNDVMRI